MDSLFNTWVAILLLSLYLPFNDSLQCYSCKASGSNEMDANIRCLEKAYLESCDEFYNYYDDVEEELYDYYYNFDDDKNKDDREELGDEEGEDGDEGNDAEGTLNDAENTIQQPPPYGRGQNQGQGQGRPNPNLVRPRQKRAPYRSRSREMRNSSREHRGDDSRYYDDEYEDSYEYDSHEYDSRDHSRNRGRGRGGRGRGRGRGGRGRDRGRERSDSSNEYEYYEDDEDDRTTTTTPETTTVIQTTPKPPAKPEHFCYSVTEKTGWETYSVEKGCKKISYCKDALANKPAWVHPWNFCCDRSRCNVKLVKDKPQRVFGMGCRRTDDCIQGHSTRPVCPHFFKSCPRISRAVVKMECRTQARTMASLKGGQKTRQGRDKKCYCSKGYFPKGPICTSGSTSYSDTRRNIIVKMALVMFPIGLATIFT